MQWCIEQKTVGVGREETKVLAYHNDASALHGLLDYIRQAYEADDPWRIEYNTVHFFRAVWRSNNARIDVTVKVVRVTGER